MPSSARQLSILILAATLTRLLLGWLYFGFHNGDDVEILEAGFLRVFGGDYQPWAIRNLLVSDLLVAPALWLASALGVEAPRLLAWLASVPFVLLASVNGWLVHRLAHGWLRSEGAAQLASALYLFHWLPLGYGSMVYPRTASTTCVLLAAALLWERRGPAKGPHWGSLWAGGLVGIAWAIRYSEVVFLLPLLATVWLQEGELRRRLKSWAWLLAGFAGVSLASVGVSDWLTWGQPFASLVAFARYTLVDKQASSLEVSQPWFWFFWRLPKWLAPTLLPLLWWARKVPGALKVAAFAVLPLLALSAIHHKQLRYLQGILPFLVLLAAAGAWTWWSRGGRKVVAGLAALSLLLGLSGLSFLTKKSMAAVLAAGQLHTEVESGRVCLSQPWAYGGSLFLGQEIEVRDLGYSLDAARLAAALPDCPWVALYQEDYQRDPELPETLKRARYLPAGEVRWGRSKPVLVFRRTALQESLQSSLGRRSDEEETLALPESDLNQPEEVPAQ